MSPALETWGESRADIVRVVLLRQRRRLFSLVSVNI